MLGSGRCDIQGIWIQFKGIWSRCWSLSSLCMFTSIIPKTPSQKQHPRLWPLIGGAALLPTAWQGVEDHRAKDVDGNTLREEIMGPFIFPHAYQSMLVPQRFPKLRAMYQSRVVTIANPGVLLICKTALREESIQPFRAAVYFSFLVSTRPSASSDIFSMKCRTKAPLVFLRSFVGRSIGKLSLMSASFTSCHRLMQIKNHDCRFEWQYEKKYEVDHG